MPITSPTTTLPGLEGDDADPVARRAFQARHGASFHHVHGLLAGVGRDLEPVAIPDDDALVTYTAGVAGTVGGWLTERVGARDRAVLARAYERGHAPQITNIVRDVGEDLDRDRVYVPADRLRSHGVTVDHLRAVRCDPDHPLPRHWPDLLEHLMTAADRSCERALGAVGALPPAFARAVAVAARALASLPRAAAARGVR